ncbi:glycosyltransferase family 2 protein [Lactococcus nasutitermitis]|uniref:Glycosyltransferase family 2 protein n=1 Tax=Lactococcus nasutitermitis TaxID=1652957 RepID=A0ABV9JBE5_9LACT|nr:glycosyltransferase family 2 protein [Lactococcus nasutitermitis]
MKKQPLQLIIRLAKIVLLYELRFKAKEKQTQAIINQQKSQHHKEAKVSILLPVYNVENFLAQCLESILNQTYQNLEIICVNDSSTDQSLTILKSYAKKDKRIKVIEKPQNEGLPQARKTALENATGDYVLNVDSDDWIEPDMVESLYYFLKSGYDMVVCDYIKETATKQEIVRTPNILIEGDKLQRIENRSFGYGNTIWNRFVKRELMEKVVFPTENIGEDIVINTQLYYYADKIGYCVKALYHWQYNEASMTRKLTEATFDSLAKNYRLIWQFCVEKFGENVKQLEPAYKKRLEKIHRKP